MCVCVCVCVCVWKVQLTKHRKLMMETASVFRRLRRLCHFTLLCSESCYVHASRERCSDVRASHLQELFTLDSEII